MPSPYKVAQVGLGGSLNMKDSPEVLSEGAATRLKNLRYAGRGRWAPRPAMGSSLANLTGDVIGIFPFPHGSDATGGDTGVVYLAYDAVGDTVELYAALPNGTGANLVGTVAGHTTVTSRPRMFGAVIGQRLFIIDAFRSKGLSVYDPNEFAGAGKLYQPVFDFNNNATAEAAKPRCLAVYNNMLFMAGYGDDSDPSRPEIVRYSYIGLSFDSLGTGDAGSGAANDNLFDRGDFLRVGQRDLPVMGMTPVAGRLLILKNGSAYVLFGHDRSSFQVELIDNEHGLVNTGALVEADGTAYWWSPVGPVRYSGGAVEPLEYDIQPRVSEIDDGFLFAAHSQILNEVQWWYRPVQVSTGDAAKAVCYNYRFNEWYERESDTGIFTAGDARISYGTLGSGGGGSPGGGDPGGGGDNEGGTGSLAGPPAINGFTNVTQDSFTVQWTPGDTSPDTVTNIYVSTDNVVFTQVGFDLDPDTQAFNITGLTINTNYWTKVEHVKGSDVQSDTAQQSTLAASAVPAPNSLTAEDNSFHDQQKGIDVLQGLLTWVNGDDTLKIRIYRSTTQGGPYTEIGDLSPGFTSTNDPVSSADTYYWRVSHVDAQGNESVQSNEASAAISIGPGGAL